MSKYFEVVGDRQIRDARWSVGCCCFFLLLVQWKCVRTSDLLIINDDIIPNCECDERSHSR